MPTPWDTGHGPCEYRVVAPAVVRLGAELGSKKADTALNVGQAVSALERWVVGKVTRLRIGPERWVSEETNEGKKLLWRVDWPSIDEREEAKAARINLGIIAHVTGALSMPLGASAVPNESVQQPKT